MPTLVTGNTAPVIKANLYYANTTPVQYVNLTGAAVAFQMRRPNDKNFLINAGATITSAISGGVAYSLGPNDLTWSGDFQCQWKVTFPDGTVQTTSVANPITIRRA